MANHRIPPDEGVSDGLGCHKAGGDRRGRISEGRGGAGKSHQRMMKESGYVPDWLLTRDGNDSDGCQCQAILHKKQQKTLRR